MRRLLGLLLLTALLAGCNHDGDDSAGGTTGGTSGGTTGTTTGSTTGTSTGGSTGSSTGISGESSGAAESPCPATHQTLLPLTPDPGETAADLATLVPCTNALRTSTWVKNVSSDTVWLVDQPAGYTWTAKATAAAPLFVQAYRESLPKGMPLTLEPGRAVVLAVAPESVHLRLDARAQAAWDAAALLRDFAADRLEERLAAGSRTRAVLVTCASAGYRAGARLTEQQDPSQALVNALGLAGDVSPCADAVRRAERQSGASAALTLDDLTRGAARPSWRMPANQRLLQAARAIQIRGF